MSNKRFFMLAILLLIVSQFQAEKAMAQIFAGKPAHEVDLALTYRAARERAVSGETFLQQGGGLELSAEAYRGMGIAMAISGDHATNANHSGVNINLVTIVFGPRYTYRHGKLAVFSQGLIGESDGFDGTYPTPTGASSTASSFALQVGGGMDVVLGRRFSVRPFEASWLRTQLPNAITNRQNGLQVGVGIVLRLQR